LKIYILEQYKNKFSWHELMAPQYV